MSGRDAILGKIKLNLDRPINLEAGRAIQTRLQAHAKNLIPQRGNLNHDQQIALFCQEASRVNGSIAKLRHFDEIPTAVSDYLRTHQLPAKIKIAPHNDFAALDWDVNTSLMIEEGRGAGDDGVSVSLAFGAVAETGTLVMTSGPETPTSLNFLPLDHIVVVRAQDIVGNYEAIWERIRDVQTKLGSEGTLPRTVNWITGPSRTADIEQTLLLGAHGPQRLHILVISEATQ